MYAIIETGGKQYRVAPGEIIKVEKLSQETGADVTIDKVLMVMKENGSICGAPYISGAKVIASVEGIGKGKKLVVHKQRPRKVYRKTNGHRQMYIALKIKDIILEA
jgi:large subunit ribosomal protein L21